MATYQVRSKIFSVKSTTTVSVEELFQFGVIAQLAERYFCKVKDVGSNPIGSTKGLEVLLVTCRTVTAKIAGSMPVQTATSRVGRRWYLARLIT